MGGPSLETASDNFSHSNIIRSVGIDPTERLWFLCCSKSALCTMLPCSEDGLDPETKDEQRGFRKKAKRTAGQDGEVRSRSIYLPVHFLWGRVTSFCAEQMCLPRGTTPSKDLKVQRSSESSESLQVFFVRPNDCSYWSRSAAGSQRRSLGDVQWSFLATERRVKPWLQSENKEIFQDFML